MPKNSLVVQWLGLRALIAEGPSSIPGWGTKIPQAAWRGQKNFLIKKPKRTTGCPVKFEFLIDNNFLV